MSVLSSSVWIANERSKLKRLIDTYIGDAELIGNFEAGSPEWHAVRKTGIGGSEIGTILAYNPYESAYTLWHKKLDLIPETDMSDNLPIWLGKVLEDPILERFSQKHPELELYKVGTYRNKKLPWMHANPDAIYINKNTGEWGIVEVKTGRNSWENVPPGYRAQVMWYLHAFGFNRGYITGFVGYQWEERVIEYDGFEAEVLIKGAERFLQALEAERKPDWDGSESTLDTVRAMNPEIDGESIEVGEIGINLWNAQRRYDEAKAELNSFKAAVMDYMGKARHATVTVDGEGTFRVASRMSRKDGLPYLVVKK